MGEPRVQLLTTDPEDWSAWIELWRLCGGEPFAHPAYVDLFAGAGGRAILFSVVDDIGCVIMPLIVRDVGVEPWARDVDVQDATSPYGYGGPFSSEPRSYEDFWRLISHWMHAEGIASLIGRLTLRMSASDPLPPGMEMRSVADNVVVDLQRPATEQWRHYAHKVRKNVNKARRAGLTAAILDQFTDVAEFVSLYQSTMERRNAHVQYFFDEQFFDTIARNLAGSFLVAEVRDPAMRLISVELVLKSDRFVYSFLGGTASDAFPHAPNDLLKHEVIEYARERDLAAYVLGGGYKDRDGIFKYKLGFDPTGIIPFRRLEAVVQPRNEDLLRLRLAWERRQGRTGTLDASFFPLYRAPLIATPPTGQDSK